MGLPDQTFDLNLRRRRVRQVQMFRQDFVAGADQQGKVDDVFQFASVARPAVLFEYMLSGFADQRHGQIKTLAVDAEEILREGEDIAGARAQRRQLQMTSLR